MINFRICSRIYRLRLTPSHVAAWNWQSIDLCGLQVKTPQVSKDLTVLAPGYMAPAGPVRLDDGSQPPVGKKRRKSTEVWTRLIHYRCNSDVTECGLVHYVIVHSYMLYYATICYT